MLAPNTHSPQITIKLRSLSKASILRSKTSLVVSKNVAKKAVERNRIKRIIKEALRQMDLPASNYSLIVKKNIAGLKTYDVQKILSKLMKRV